MPLVGVVEAAQMEIDPRTGTAEQLATLFPELGALTAEDLVFWREAHGALPDRAALVDDLGVPPDVADAMVAHERWRKAKAPERTSGEHPIADPEDVESLDDGHRAEEARPPREEAPAPPRESARPRATPPPLPLVEPPSAATPAEKAAPRAAPERPRKTFVSMVMFTLLFALNVAAIVGLLLTRRDHRREIAPIGSIATGLAALSAAQEGTRTELEGAKAKLAQQDAKIAAVARATEENAARQQAAEREAQAREAREARAAREMAAIAGRVSTLERRARDGAVTMTLQEALPLIDAASGTKAPVGEATASSAPVHGPPRAHHTH